MLECASSCPDVGITAASECPLPWLSSATILLHKLIVTMQILQADVPHMRGPCPAGLENLGVCTCIHVWCHYFSSVCDSRIRAPRNRPEFVGFWQSLSSLHVNVMRTWESCSVIMYG